MTVVAQGLFALNSMVWVLILASRLDDRKFGQVASLTALALFLAGVVRAWVAEPAFVGQPETRSTRRFGALVFSGATAALAAPLIVGETMSATTAIVFGACATLVSWYEVHRAETLSAGRAVRAIGGELMILPALSTVALTTPTAASAVAIASSLLAVTALGRIAFAGITRSGTGLPSARQQFTYVLDFVMAGGTFSAFVIVSAMVWSPQFAGELRLAQALAGPATTLMLAAWLAAQRLARDQGPASATVSRLQIAVTATTVVYAAGGVGLTLLGSDWRIVPPVAVAAAVLGARCSESLTLKPALVLRHTARPQRIIVARALTALTLLGAVPILFGSASLTARGWAIASAYAWPLPVWYWMSRASTSADRGRERRASDPAGTAE